MAATARKRKSQPQEPANLQEEALKRDLQALIATTSTEEPDKRWDVEGLSDAVGHPSEATASALISILRDAGYRRGDQGPAWLDEKAYAELNGARRDLPGMSPAETYGTIQGFPVTKFRGRVQTFTITDRAIAKELMRLKGRATLLISVVSNNPAFDEIRTKAEGADESNYQQTVKLEVISVRLVDATGAPVPATFGDTEDEEVDEEDEG